jgi:hypothetical protein
MLQSHLCFSVEWNWFHERTDTWTNYVCDYRWGRHLWTCPSRQLLMSAWNVTYPFPVATVFLSKSMSCYGELHLRHDKGKTLEFDNIICFINRDIFHTCSKQFYSPYIVSDNVWNMLHIIEGKFKGQFSLKCLKLIQWGLRSDLKAALYFYNLNYSETNFTV